MRSNDGAGRRDSICVELDQLRSDGRYREVRNNQCMAVIGSRPEGPVSNFAVPTQRRAAVASLGWVADGPVLGARTKKQTEPRRPNLAERSLYDFEEMLTQYGHSELPHQPIRLDSPGKKMSF